MRSLSSLFIIVVACHVGCAPKQAAPARSPVATEPAAIEEVAVDDEGFAAATLAVLEAGVPSPRRLGLLVGVVQRQLDRATRLFQKGHEEMGLAALRGALYILRDGELRPEMLAGRSAALSHAAAAFARLGNEGQTEALYALLVERLPAGPEREDARQHLEALRRWQEDTRSPGSMQARGAAQQAALQQALLDPSREALERARDETLAWTEQAIAFGAEQLPPQNNFEQDEAIEAFRAIRTAPLTLVAIYLRHGDPQGALAALDDENVARITAPNLRQRVEGAADGDPEAWAELFRLFESAEASEEMGVLIDPDLGRAAAWGAAIELYRVEPRAFRSAMALSSLLLAHGMGEAAPLLLQRALEGSTEAREASWALRFVLEAIRQADSLGDLPAARRVFAHSEPLIALTEREAYRGRVTPSKSRLHFFMGAIESAAGELERARAHLKNAIALEPTADALRLLASIDRQRRDYPAALASLDEVIELTKGTGDSAAQAETHLSKFEVLREMGQTARAAESLESALMLVLSARTSAQTTQEQAVAERVLGRVLEHYDARDAARRAGKRAYEASRNDLQQLSQTLLDTSRRALTTGDLRAARDAVRHGLDADLPDEDMVYAALWLDLLEQRLKVPSDGTAEEALASIEPGNGWISKLADWGRGKLSTEDLVNQAQTRIERVEARFYAAMSSPGDERSLEKLRDVARSEAIQLVEVTIARDLIASREKQPTPRLPANVQLP